MRGLHLLEGLNTAQRQAVVHAKGPLLIIAGAGAGKTRTVAHRIAYLIEGGVSARHILAVTFTNKAAGEMRNRVRSLGPNATGGALIATFHSLGVRLLREFHKEAGIPSTFTIWDRDDSIRALKKILVDLDMGDMTPRSVLAAISRAKSDCLSGEAYAEQAVSFREQCITRAWDRYEKVLREEDALDFDDLLLRTLTLLNTSPNTLSLLQARWKYLHVDEYQDTNKAQYEIARLLAGETKNICAVADLDQCIYTWRGARLENLLEFEREFPNTTTVLLEQNYRSTRTIISAANSVIEKNVRRKPKKLFTERETGEAITLYAAENDIDEAWFVARAAQRFIARGMNPSSIAVLYRENFQSRALEEVFLHLNTPYRVIGTRFFERREVKDVLSYLRASLNPKARADITRIIASPPRGIGKVTLAKMLSGDALGGTVAKKVADFRATLHDIGRATDILPASEAVRFAYERSGIEAYIAKYIEGGAERAENIRELVNLSTRYDDEQPPQGILKLLEEAALQSDQDELEKPMDAVSLMTVHASKGLEFDVVFITGLEQGLFPAIRAESAERDPEEERRLFYVALTRARKRLFLSYATERMRWSSRERTLPSEFLEDIDSRLVESAKKEHVENERTIE